MRYYSINVYNWCKIPIYYASSVRLCTQNRTGCALIGACVLIRTNTVDIKQK